MTYRERAQKRVFIWVGCTVVLMIGMSLLGWQLTLLLNKLLEPDRVQLTLAGIYIGVPVLVMLSQLIAAGCIRSMDYVYSGLSPAMIDMEIIYLTEYKEYLDHEAGLKRMHGEEDK